VGQDIIGEATDDYFGYSVSLSASGDRLAIGVRQAHELAGEVQVHDLIRSSDEGSSGDWSLVGEAIRGQSTKDQSGFSVSLSADGRMIAIGSPYHIVALPTGGENGESEELGGEIAFSAKPNAGQARIFWIGVGK
jgi:hypothetical protein